MLQLKPIALTAENFAEYGRVISQGTGKPMADNEEYLYWGKVSELKMSETASTGVLVPKRREPVVSQLERHVKTPEILAALEGDSLLCVAKPSRKSDEIEGVQAFLVRQGDAFAMHPGTWHWVPFPINGETCKFLVTFASGTEDEDLVVKSLPEAIKIDW